MGNTCIYFYTLCCSALTSLKLMPQRSCFESNKYYLRSTHFGEICFQRQVQKAKSKYHLSFIEIDGLVTKVVYSCTHPVTSFSSPQQVSASLEQKLLTLEETWPWIVWKMVGNCKEINVIFQYYFCLNEIIFACVCVCVPRKCHPQWSESHWLLTAVLLNLETQKTTNV